MEGAWVDEDKVKVAGKEDGDETGGDGLEMPLQHVVLTAARVCSLWYQSCMYVLGLLPG